MDCVIGCDVGSQGTKAILLAATGKVLGEAYAPYAIDYPRPLWAEQPVERWVDGLTFAIQQLISQTGVPVENVRALSLATQVDGLVAIDSSGKPLRSAMIWMDRRAAPQCELVSERLGEAQVFDLTGLNIDPSHVAPKIRWVMEHQPEIFERAAHFLLPGSYLAYYLTGELAVDYSNASSTLLLDVHTKTWSPMMSQAFDIDIQRLPPLGAATTVIGRIRSKVAEEVGLSSDTLIMIGCGDEHAACIGAGVNQSGLVCDIAGTAEPVCAASSEIVFDPKRLVETHCHADPNFWLLENPGFVSGANYRWFRDQFSVEEVTRAAQEGVDAYILLNAMAETVPAGSDGLIMLPCLMGAMAPTWNASARGTFMGITLAHRREHFCRAILEASAYAVRDITDQMLHMGLPLREIRAVGGGARSPLWRQIKADVTGLPVSITETVETTALGAGIIALTGSGLIGSISEAVGLTTRVIETREPDPKTRARYED